MDLLENLPIAEIETFFADRGFALMVHTDPPTDVRDPPPLREPAPTHWVDLSPTARWYGSGEGAEQAIRSAARRWRIEQIGSEAERSRPERHLPP